MALVVYVAKTWEMASATRQAAKASSEAYAEAIEARKEALAPRVIVYIDPQVWLLDLVVENVGAGTARDLSITFDPPLQTTRPRHSPKWFDSTHPLFPPGYKLSHTVDVWEEYLKSELPRRYAVTVRFHGVENNKQYAVTHTLDVETFRHFYMSEDKGVHDIAVELERLHRTLQEIGKSALRHLGDAKADKLLLPDRPSGRSVPRILGDITTGWWVFATSFTQQGQFQDRKALVRRIRPDVLALLEELERLAYPAATIAHARRLCALFLDEREAGYMTTEWQASVVGTLRALHSASGLPIPDFPSSEA